MEGFAFAWPYPARRDEAPVVARPDAFVWRGLKLGGRGGGQEKPSAAVGIRQVHSRLKR